MKNCDTCAASVIQGVFVHEQGCPNDWKDMAYECKECGSAFIPHSKDEKFCSHSCHMLHSGLSCDCAECMSMED